MITNQKGFTLVEGMISVAIFGILAASFSAMMAAQANSYAVAREGLEILTLQASLHNTLLNGDQCSCNFRDLTLSGPTVAIDSRPLSLFQLDPATSACTPTETLVGIGTQTHSRLNVTSIELDRVVQIAPGLASAELLVRIKGASQTRAPIRSQKLYLQTANVSGVTKVANCRTSTKTQITKISTTRIWEADAAPQVAGLGRFDAWEKVETDEIRSYSPTQPSRLTIPNGVNRVRLHASLCFDHNPASAYQHEAVITMNGVAIGHNKGYGSFASHAGIGDHIALQIHTPVLDVKPGDYFEVHVKSHRTGARVVPTDSCNTETAFSMETVN
jgi:prepilin-type N-terminal cleavage/methylation domain-containing protein